MTPADLARVHTAAFDRDRGWSAEEFAALLDHPGTLLVGDARAFVLGRIILDEVEILTLATSPSVRRQGLARTRLDAFETVARTKGAARSMLEVAADNEAARALYRAADYHEIGRRNAYYRRSSGPPADALVLEKALFQDRSAQKFIRMDGSHGNPTNSG